MASCWLEGKLTVGPNDEMVTKASMDHVTYKYIDWKRIHCILQPILSDSAITPVSRLDFQSYIPTNN